MAAGTAAALPAVEAAAIPATPSPPVNLSAIIKAVPLRTTTASPIKPPNRPALQTVTKFSGLPRANAKNGIRSGKAGERTCLMLQTKLQRTIPRTGGKIVQMKGEREKAPNPA